MMAYVDKSVMVCEGSFQIALRCWGDPSSRERVIAYPGWLDNVGSFDTMGPFFARNNFYLVVIDPPGCGLSQHRPLSAYYNDFEESAMIIEIAEVGLGWKKDNPFLLMAHSRGGGVIGLTASVWRDYVKGVVGYDTMLHLFTGNFFADPVKDSIIHHMNACFEMDRKNRQRKPRVFESLEEAIQVNYNHPWFKKSYESARNITMRHVKPLPDNSGKYIFTHDVRTYGQRQLLHVSQSMMTEFLKSLANTPVLFILAERPMPGDFGKYRQAELVRLDTLLNKLTVVFLNGGHHIHSDEPEKVFKVFLDWHRKHFADGPSASIPKQKILPPELQLPSSL